MYLPNQRLTDKEKIEQFGSIENWGEQVIDSLLNFAGFSAYGANDYYQIQTNLDLYNGYINIKDLNYVTNPYGLTNQQFPAQLQNYNIIKPKIDLLVGEEIKRPFNFKVISTNPDAVSTIEEIKKQMLLEMLQGILLQELAASGQIDPQEVPETVLTPEQIQEFINTNYSDMREILGQQALDYLMWYCDLKTKFNKGMKEYLITGCELYYTGISSGEPVCFNVDPRFFYCELSSDSTYVEDAQYCYYQRFLTASDIYDEFYDVLKEEDINRIEGIKNNTNYLNIADTSLGVPITYSDVDMSSKSVFNNHALIRVLHCCWQGLRKIGFLTYIDEKGQIQETIVDEYYKVNSDLGEKVEWKWINEVWEGTKIGSEIFVNVRPIPNQAKSLDNPSKCKLPYTGVFKHNSLVSIMKPHQYFYDILMYRLELSIARAKDKIMVMDIAQIPRSLGIDTQKWMYYMDTLGVAFINSFEEGTGNVGRGKASSFNQFQSIDMSLGNIMNQYIIMLDKVEDMIGEISGVSRQRQGQVSTSELVGNVERSVVQSSHITEPLFFIHNEVKRRVLTNLLEVSKIAWINGKKGQYVTEDLARVYFNIDGAQFADAEFGIFISNSSKDDRIIETLRAIAQDAVRSGIVGLKDIADILSTDSIANIKRKLDIAEEKQHNKTLEIEKQKQEGMQQQLELQLQDKQADRDVDIENNIRDNETKLTIAEMSKDMSKGNETNTMELQNKFTIDQQKLQIDREKNFMKNNLDKESINIGKQAANKDNEIKDKQLELEKQKLKHDMKMKAEEIKIKRMAARNKPKTPNSK